MPYRVELASSGRAGCKELACKKAGDKIQKGEFRFGSLVTIHEHQSWVWKHWGCTTPAQITNLQEASDGDIDMVDGYDELPAEYQEKVKTALEVGHVADEDWKGDPEFNRPGKKGMRKRQSKKAAKDQDEEEEKEESAEEKPATKKRGRPAKAAEDVVDAPVPKKRGRPAKAVQDIDDAPAPKKARGRKKAVAKEEDESEEEAPKAKKARGKKVKEEVVEAASDGSAAEEPEAEAPKAKRGRKAATAKVDKPAAAPQKRPKKKGAAV